MQNLTVIPRGASLISCLTGSRTIAPRRAYRQFIEKLGRKSDKSYADLYSVRQRKIEFEKDGSIYKRLDAARARAEKHNAEVKNLVVERRKGKGIVL